MLVKRSIGKSVDLFAELTDDIWTKGSFPAHWKYANSVLVNQICRDKPICLLNRKHTDQRKRYETTQLGSIKEGSTTDITTTVLEMTRYKIDR